MSIINIANFDLSQLPPAETDDFEFKSSSTLHSELSKKLSCAASGFANSGGGCFVVGVGNDGNADGGFSPKIGRQDLTDWVDQVIHQVEPAPRYEIKLIKDAAGRGTIKPDTVVLLVLIHESNLGPHMAPDKHYYIRAGAHMVKAKHFIVDAIWAKRHFAKPCLTHLLRLKTNGIRVIQLGILALTDVPAVNVEIQITPLPGILKRQASVFPLHLPLIDLKNPMFIDVQPLSQAQPSLQESISLHIKYHDLAGNPYEYKKTIESSNSALPIILS